MLRFTRHYEDSIQEKLTILMRFVSNLKFTWVYGCQQLSK